MKRFLFFLSILIVCFSCKKDCLQKGKCELSNYNSDYLELQPLPATTATIYYIDAENGLKNNSGTAASSAFKEMKDLEELTFKPGDQILFKRGQIHYGDFTLQQGGNATQRIVIADYGDGDLPVLKSRDFKKGNKETIKLNQADYVSLLNLNIQGGLNAILLSNSDYFLIAGCRIGEQSDAGLRATGLYSDGEGSDFGVVHHCLFDSGLRGEFGDGQSTDGIQLIDGANNWYIHHNEFKAWRHSAINIKQIYSDYSSNNNNVEHNLFECGDIDYMRAFDMIGGDQLVMNNIIQFNVVKNQSVTSHIDGNDNVLAFNQFIGVKITKASDQPWAVDMKVFNGNSGGVERKKYVCYNNKVHHNLIYNYKEGVGFRIMDSSDGTDFEIHDNEIINNLIINTGKAFEIDYTPQSLTIKNNLIYNDEGNEKFFFNSIDYPFIEFQALTGTQSHLIEDNIIGNPNFLNASSGDFTLGLGSYAIDAGMDLGYVLDFNGSSFSGGVDIGPFQN